MVFVLVLLDVALGAWELEVLSLCGTMEVVIRLPTFEDLLNEVVLGLDGREHKMPGMMSPTAHVLTNRIWSAMLLFTAGLTVIALAGCGEVGPNADGDHERRVEVVAMVESGQLTERSEYGDIVLPDGYEDLSNVGVITVREDPFMVFFATWTGFSPDPYCGYEYSPDPSAVVVDPHNSGVGEAEPLGDGWYWICAS